MRKGRTLLLLLVLAPLWTATSRAQQAGAQVGQTPVSGPDTTEAPASPTVGAMSPLAGAQVLTPGFMGEAHSFVLPTLGCSEYANSNPTGYAQNSKLFSESTCVGALTLQRVGRHSQLNLDDAGGGLFFNRSLRQGTAANASRFEAFDELGISEQVSGSRWNWQVGDRGAYLPETPEGFAGFGTLANYIGGEAGGNSLSNAPALNSAFQPNQALYTGLSKRLSDLATTQFDYSLNARSIITGTAMVGTLQYMTPGFIDNTYWMAMGGYNYYFGRGDEIALTYDENHFLFTGGHPGFVNRGLSVLYGHRINGRLSFEVSVAPMINVIPVPPSKTVTAFYLSTFDSLQYVAARWDASLSLSRGMTGGAGVATGAARNMVEATFGRRFSPKLHGSAHTSFNDTRSIAQENAGFSSVYNYWQIGLNLERDIGPHVSMFMNYNVERQVSNRAVCVGTECATTFLRQVGGIGLNWHVRRVSLE